MFVTEEFPDVHFNGREIPRVEYWLVPGLCNFVPLVARPRERGGGSISRQEGLTQSGQTLAKDVVSPLHTLPPPVLLWPPEQRDVRWQNNRCGKCGFKRRLRSSRSHTAVKSETRPSRGKSPTKDVERGAVVNMHT